MRRRTILSAAALLPSYLKAQDTKNFPTLGAIHRLDPRLDKLIARDAKIEVVASGFDWAEGPVWIPADNQPVAQGKGGFLLFSDIPRNAIMKWKEGEGASVYLKPAGYTGLPNGSNEPGTNGLTLDPQGRLVCCEHGDRRIARLEPGGGKRTLVDNYQGKRLNSPNDLVYRSNGDLYFSDPPYGLPGGWDSKQRELDFCGVYKLTPKGQLTLLTRELTRPNGLAFSPDEKTLYVAQSEPEKAIWMAYPVTEDGTLLSGRVFGDVTPQVKQLPGLPDGMKVDQEGNLWATGPGGVSIMAPDGTQLGRIETGERTANLAWGDDGSVAYLTADMYLCRVKTRTKRAS
jgi:gluconolactonase